jgi:hypothetical protein
MIGPAHPARHRRAGCQSRTCCRWENPVKRNRYIQLSGATKSVNRELEAKTRALAAGRATTNLTSAPAEFVIEAYHQLWHIEKSFRMSKHDLHARPVYHHTREWIGDHLSIVFAALAVSHWIERQTGWSIKTFVRTARRYRTVPGPAVRLWSNAWKESSRSLD